MDKKDVVVCNEFVIQVERVTLQIILLVILPIRLFYLFKDVHGISGLCSAESRNV